MFLWSLCSCDNYGYDDVHNDIKKNVMYHTCTTCISYADNQKNGTDEGKPKPAKEVEDSGSPTISLM